MVARTSTGLRPAVGVWLVAILLVVGCGSATGHAAQSSAAVRPSGIAGRAVAIVCGGPASEHGCPHRPVRATIDVLRMPSRRHIATVHTDASGHFRLDLPPGTYELRGRTSTHLIWSRAVTTRVLPHQISHTVVTFMPRHPLPVVLEPAPG